MNSFIGSFTDFLIRHTMKLPEGDERFNPTIRMKYAFLEAWISIIGNVILAIIKFVFGFMLNSISLIADAVHTASDVLTSFVVILGFKLSGIPADEKHPHGHGRIEFIATLMISLMLIGVGIKFGMSSYERLLANTPVKGSLFVAGLMVVAGLIKEIMSRISTDLGQRINSSTLVADAWHHRTDAFASIMVAIAIVASKYGYFKVDAILGFVVSALIIYTGFEIFMDSSSKLIGEIDEEEIQIIYGLARSIEGVMDVHDISVHDYGAKKEISIHIEVNQNLSVMHAHDIAKAVEKHLNHTLFATSIVHVDGSNDSCDN
ncbi:MAG: cation diffusion facilitator family transporter [Bacillota bacterium]|nr:cation diffusion facilitator family transporter [Bacillota bacterium]